MMYEEMGTEIVEYELEEMLSAFLDVRRHFVEERGHYRHDSIVVRSTLVELLMDKY